MYLTAVVYKAIYELLLTVLEELLKPYILTSNRNISKDCYKFTLTAC